MSADCCFRNLSLLGKGRWRLLDTLGDPEGQKIWHVSSCDPSSLVSHMACRGNGGKNGGATTGRKAHGVWGDPYFFLIRRITPDLCVKRCTQPSMEAGVFSFLGGCIVLNTLMTGLAMLKEHSSFSATDVQNEQVCLQNCRIGLIAEFWNHDNSGYYESWNLPIWLKPKWTSYL